MTKVTLLGSLAAVLLLGAGCSSGSSVTVGGEEVGSTVKTPVAFSTLTKDLLMAKEDYSEFRFEDGTGTCIDQGVPSVFSYVEDPALGYFIVSNADGSYKELVASASAAGYVMFDEVKLADGSSAACTALAEYGKDAAPVTCKVKDKEVCTGSYTVVAIPR